jgi:hypothetical protein
MVSKKNFVSTALAAALVGGGFAMARDSHNSIVPVQAAQLNRVPRPVLLCRHLPIWLSASRRRWSISR